MIQGVTAEWSFPSLSAKHTEYQVVTNKVPEKVPEKVFFRGFFLPFCVAANVYANPNK